MRRSRAILAAAAWGNASTRAIMLILLAGCATTAPNTTPRPSSQRSPAATTRSAAKIAEFQGKYRFLSNFYPAAVVFEGITYPTAEHAYQSAKTTDMVQRRRIAALATPADAKREGRALSPQRLDWDQVKFDVMEKVIRDKFSRNPELRAKLLATGDAYLEEGNTWNDRIWGVFQGQGENRLGKIIMQVRDELRAQ